MPQSSAWAPDSGRTSVQTIGSILIDFIFFLVDVFFFFCIGLFASADWDGVLLWDFCLGKFNDDTIRALIFGHPHTKPEFSLRSTNAPCSLYTCCTN